MTSIKTLALAAAAVAGLGLFATTDAEARGFGGRGGRVPRWRFPRRWLPWRRPPLRRPSFRGPIVTVGYWRGGRWLPYAVGVGVIGTAAVIADSCYRSRWVDTPYGLVRQRVNICD